MGLLDLLRGRPSAQANTSAPTPEPRYAQLPDDGYQHVVGESFYQPALAATDGICVPGEEGRRTFRACVLAEPDNPYDADAIAVHSERGKVGHLSREDAQRYKRVMVELHRQGYPGFACTAFLNGGSSDKPNYGVVLKLAAHRSCERELGVASEPGVDLREPVDTSAPAFVRGKHFTEYVEEVRSLRRHKHDDTAEALLLELVGATEAESAAQGHGVAPWYYEQLAIIYRKEKDYNAEVAILDRFASQPHAPGAQPPKLLERREKARALATQA